MNGSKIYSLRYLTRKRFIAVAVLNVWNHNNGQVL